MKLVFCGTPEFAVPTLEAVLAAGHNVELVVTQPDRPSGRGMELSIPPVKRTALLHGIPVVQPDKIKNNAEFRARLESIRPDVILVVAYGRIIPQVDARSSNAWQHQSPCVPSTEVSRSRSYPVGDCHGRKGNRRNDDAAG